MSESLSTQTPPAPQPIVPPPNFPVVWKQADDERLHWTYDRLHLSGSSKPIEVSTGLLTFGGLDQTFAEQGIARETRVQLINTFMYTAAIASPPDPNKTAAPIEEDKDKQLEELGRLQEKWDNEWLPEIQAHLAFWRDYDLVNAALPDLVSHLDETKSHFGRLWKLHFEIVIPAFHAMDQFETLYEELFGSDDVLGAYALLEGLGNKTVEIGLALWRMSRAAVADDTVRAAITQGSPSGAKERLQQSEEGRRFLTHLDEFLEEHGQRTNTGSIASPSWLEDPTPVFVTLREYVLQPDRDFEQELSAAAVRLEERIAEVRSQLAGYPQAVVDRFELLLRAAQIATILKEDHGYWIDFYSSYMVRRVFLELGHRLAQAGVIEQQDDVFYLDWDEARATAAALPQLDRKALIATRKAEEQRFAQIEPPEQLGMPPAEVGPSPFGKMFGNPPPEGQTPELIRGNPGSPGKARGPVKVVRHLEQAEKVESGDVLVAVNTGPTWTPLFAVAAAVVTDTGGVLSHCALVAREYGIPAVVGTGSASTLLHDGQIVEVDGKSGTVRAIG